MRWERRRRGQRKGHLHIGPHSPEAKASVGTLMGSHLQSLIQMCNQKHNCVYQAGEQSRVGYFSFWRSPEPRVSISELGKLLGTHSPSLPGKEAGGS